MVKKDVKFQGGGQEMATSYSLQLWKDSIYKHVICIGKSCRARIFSVDKKPNGMM